MEEYLDREEKERVIKKMIDASFEEKCREMLLTS